MRGLLHRTSMRCAALHCTQWGVALRCTALLPLLLIRNTRGFLKYSPDCFLPVQNNIKGLREICSGNTESIEKHLECFWLVVQKHFVAIHIVHVFERRYSTDLRYRLSAAHKQKCQYAIDGGGDSSPIPACKQRPCYLWREDVAVERSCFT